ncbi:F16A2 protein, partial [Glaucidium brasilianum]|nr:F16A2 protein [Glaucidium brasilianum]
MERMSWLSKLNPRAGGQRPPRSTGLQSPVTADPETCLMVFKNHWAQVLRILERRGCKPAPDDLSAVRNNTYQMLNLLAEDRPRGEASRGPILDFVASENVLERLLCWHLQGDFPEERKVEQLKLYEMLISQARQPLLRHRPVLAPLLRLLSLCAEPASAPLENSLVLLLNQLCVSVAKEPAVLELFFHSHADQGPANLIIFSLLIPFIHHEGVLGQQARDALLLIMAMSATNRAVAASITDNSYFCPVLATGLSALYSSLPRKIEVRGDDWHFLRREDWIGVSSLVLFMNSLEFCNAVSQVAHPLVQQQLVDYVHNGFLVPVMGPALHKVRELPSRTLPIPILCPSRPLPVPVPCLSPSSACPRPCLLPIPVPVPCPSLSLSPAHPHPLPVPSPARPCPCLLPIPVPFPCPSLSPACPVPCPSLSLSPAHPSPRPRPLPVPPLPVPVPSPARPIPVSCPSPSPARPIPCPSPAEPPPPADLHRGDDRQHGLPGAELLARAPAEPNGAGVTIEAFTEELREIEAEMKNGGGGEGAPSSPQDPPEAPLSREEEEAFASFAAVPEAEAVGRAPPRPPDPLAQLVASPPRAVGPPPSQPFTGPFVSVLFGKLENMLHNSLYVNFLLTGLVAQLACYPQPLLRSFLLNTNMVFQPSVKSLLQVLGSVKNKIEAFAATQEDFPALLFRAKKFLIARGR